MVRRVAGNGIGWIGVLFRSVEGESTMRTLRLAGVTALCVMVLSGCEVSRSYKGYSDEVDSWSYPKRFAITWKDWGLSLLDIVSLEIGAQESIGIVIQPTKILQTGFLFNDVMKLGWRNRGFGFYHEVQSEGGFGWAYYRSRRFEPILGTPTLFDQNLRTPLFAGFPIRNNFQEGHWADIGGEVGLVFLDVSAHVSPKHAMGFCVNTLMLPMNLLLRYPLNWIGVRFPELDFCDENTTSQIKYKYDLTLIPYPTSFAPAEVLNELWEVPY
jgi:hypothetical protein